MATETNTTEQKKIQHRQLTGEVVSDTNDKTIVVSVERRLRHKLYGKLFSRTRKFHVHDPKNQYKKGDVVTFVASRPMSKQKRWRVLYNEQNESNNKEQ